MTGKRSYHHGDLRKALLDGAAAMLEEDGPDALSLRELARRTGVSPRAPYRHFADKEVLLTALAADGFAALGDALGRADAEAPKGHEVEAQAQAYVSFAIAAPRRFRLMFGPRRSTEVQNLVTAKDAAFAVSRHRIAHETADGADVQARAVGFWSLVHGLATLIIDGNMINEMGDDHEVVGRVMASMLQR